MLKPGAPIPGQDSIARWCRRRYVDEGVPKVSAFYPRPGESYLSGNWLQYYSEDRDIAITKIRDHTSLTLHKDDRFVVLEVEQILDAMTIGGGHNPSVTFKPEDDNVSHAAMKWDDFPLNSQVIASELLTKVTSADIYPAQFL